MCVDIKKLDYAKNHLQTSITSLNRLQMLINAVNQLEILAQDYHYKEVANLLDAVRQFMSHFEKYSQISVISDLHKRIENIRSHLTRHIKGIFTEIAEKMDSVADIEVIIVDLIPGGSKGLGDACRVIDALGHNVRRDFFSDFLKSQLIGYDQLFGPDKEYSALEFMDRRFAWFKRLMKYIEQKFSTIFPAHWRMSLRLCLEFIERTKMHLILVLTQLESREEQEGINMDVQLILKSLQSSIKFEQEMTEKFQLLSELKKVSLNEEKEIQKRLHEQDKLMYLPVDYDQMNSEEETESGFLTLAHNVLSNGISSIFDKFLSSYVALVKSNLQEMLKRVVSEEEVIHQNSEETPSGNKNTIYNSSTNMFIFIKNAIKQCISLSNGITFQSLSDEFMDVMQEYAEILASRMSSDSMVCYVVNTAEYCTEVIPQLEQMIQQKIQPSLANKINFQEVVDTYLDVIARHMKLLVNLVLDKMEGGYRTMVNTNWGAFEQVGEESKYLHVFNNVLIDSIPRIRSVLSSSFFQNFCTKLATEILTRWASIQDSIFMSVRMPFIFVNRLLCIQISREHPQGKADF
ncbi:hypothetical protein EON65_01680 [archaeon]|nr:MAG: hypothetical protein EON65_01680 [archaeon]